MNVTIIGDGAMATVAALILADNGHTVRLWGYFREAIDQMRQTRQSGRFLPGVNIPPQVRLTADDDKAFLDADIIVSAVPTQFIRNVYSRLKPYCPPGVPVVSTSKGIENTTLLRPTQILVDVLDGSAGVARPVAALSGPSIAPEVARRLPTTVAVAATDPALAATVQSIFSTPYFRVYTNPDLLGVELGGAVKNVVAIAAGILDGLGAGDNAKAALLTRGLVEITRLGVAMGARRDTFAGLAGLGDLVTTCVSPVGRNRSFGEAVGKGHKPEEVLQSMAGVVEGVATTRSVVELARNLNVEMPITEGVYAVLFQDKDVTAAISDLMQRAPKCEDAEWA